MNIEFPVLEKISKAFDLDIVSLVPYGTGLINQTWKLESRGKNYILQKLNQSVFKEPYLISSNTRKIKKYLQERYPGYTFIAPLDTVTGEPYLPAGKDLYRLIPFVEGSVGHDTVTTSKQAYEAARQFGKFTRLLEGIDIHQIGETIPGFHDLDLIYSQFESAVKYSAPGDLISANGQLVKIGKYKHILATYNSIKSDPRFIQRVMHHDCKISNVLFDNQDSAICIIDLDTVMPGLFISDTGDLIRTCVCPVSEEETNLDCITVREEYYKAIEEGYREEMNDLLSNGEKESFFYSGSFMIYMQALRFLTDHLRHDMYYPVNYPGHNLDRCSNQLMLLEKYLEKEPVLNRSGKKISGTLL